MLFKTDDDLQDYTALSQEMFAAVKSLISTIENKHIVPLLGADQFNELNNAYTADENTMAERLKVLLDYCRKITGPYLCVYYAPKSDVQVSDAGVRRAETENLKTAFQYQVKNFIAANLAEAMDAEELLLAYLENNAGIFPIWRDAADNKQYRKLFIKTATEFNELFNTAAPHTNFRALRSTMVDVEEITVRHQIGNTIFDALKIKTMAGTVLSSEEKELMLPLKKAIAAFTIAQAIPFIHLRIGEEGLTSAGGNFASNDAISSRIPASDNAISFLKRSATDRGQSWMARAQQVIKSYPLIFEVAVKTVASARVNKTLFGL
jgi:hypothetical protein